MNDRGEFVFAACLFPAAPSRFSHGGQTTIQDKQTKQTPWPLVRERTIPTERPPLVDEI
jgi:hypothetical protein